MRVFARHAHSCIRTRCSVSLQPKIPNTDMSLLFARAGLHGEFKKGDAPIEWFRMKFGGKNIWVHVSDNAAREVSGKVLHRKRLGEGMKLELFE